MEGERIIQLLSEEDMVIVVKVVDRGANWEIKWMDSWLTQIHVEKGH